MPKVRCFFSTMERCWPSCPFVLLIILAILAMLAFGAIILAMLAFGANNTGPAFAGLAGLG